MPRPMLTEAQLSAIDRIVEEIRGPYHRGIGDPLSFARLRVYPVLAGRFPGIPAPSLRAAGLMSLLKPKGGGPPPPILHHELDLLLERVQRAVSRRRLRWEELEGQVVLAYACGWRRRVRNIHRPLWDLSTWPEAVSALIRCAEKHIGWVLGILRSDVYGFPDPRTFDRTMLAFDCVGIYTGMRPITDRAYENRQSIHNWNPQIGSLLGCLLRAIDGFGVHHGKLKVNQFRNGLLYPALKAEGVLDIGRVAFRVCPHCEVRTEYGTTSFCRACGDRDSEMPGRIIDSPRLIYPPAYTTIPFRKCRTAKCGTYVRGNDASCPHCGGRLSPRTTQLLVQEHLIEPIDPNTLQGGGDHEDDDDPTT